MYEEWLNIYAIRGSEKESTTRADPVNMSTVVVLKPHRGNYGMPKDVS